VGSNTNGLLLKYDLSAGRVNHASNINDLMSALPMLTFLEDAKVADTLFKSAQVKVSLVAVP
jgi:hypothetical protein